MAGSVSLARNCANCALLFAWFAVVAAQPSPPAAPTLVDPAIAASFVSYLDGNDWVVTSPGQPEVRGTVPGDLLTDLQAAGVIGDPNYELNWLADSPTWWGRVWTYTKSFPSPPPPPAGTPPGTATLLVLDGVKMPATVSVNGVPVGHTTNQFLRYTFDVTAALHAPGGPPNALALAFDSADDTTEGRFMASSGGWDWAAYIWNTTVTGYGAGAPTPTRTLTSGVWRSVYLARVDGGSAAISHLVPHVFYNGAGGSAAGFPTTPLSDDDHAGFTVRVRVHLLAPAGGATGVLNVTGAWPGAAASVPVTAPAGESNVTVVLAAPVGSVRLWWPAGTGGGQPLYAVRATFSPAPPGAPVATSRRVGFRYIAVVTGNDTDAAWVAANAAGDGNDNLGMLLRVNGAAIMVRGANMIPIDEFEGRYSAAATARLVRSAAEARMNVLRVWGGGVYQPPAFYDAADDNGILVYHDFMYAQNGHSPKDGAPAQAAEFRHQVRRISSHASLAIFDGCNECHVVLNSSTAVYATFVLATVVDEDVSHAVWPSCPSNGWAAGVWRLDSLPNGSPLGLLPNARPPLPPAAAAPPSCQFIANSDVDGDGPAGSLPGTSAADCCAKCAANQPACASVVWDPEGSGSCWIKYDGGTPTPRPNRTACILNGHVARRTIEVHGPYQHGSGFPAVNGGGGSALDPFPSGYPAAVDPAAQLGLAYQSVFTSEFGATGFSSFESMAPTLAPEHWGMHGGGPPDVCGSGFENSCNGTNVMAQRNYPQDNYLVVYFGTPQAAFDAVGPDSFKWQTYLSQIAMALNIKMKVESKRAANCFGTMIWQLGEIWPTGGWGSLEYASPAAGGVVGGRWKPTHNWYATHLFSDVFVVCGASVAGGGTVCLVKNDRFLPFAGSLTISVLDLASGAEAVVHAEPALSMPAGPGAPLFVALPEPGVDGARQVLRAYVRDAAGALVTDSFHPLLPPANWTGLPAAASVAAVVADAPNADGSIDVTLTTDATAAFVTMTTLAQGRFSDNAFFLSPPPAPPKTVAFYPWADDAVDTLRASLRVDHLAAAQAAARADAASIEAARARCARA